MESKEDRLEWLDAMRGFTMLLVVAYHVAQFSFAENLKTSTSIPFLVLFRMPLFFFVSGFLAYKANMVWTTKSFLSITWKKIKVQVFPALVFLLVFIIFKSKYTFCDGLMYAMKTPTKDGYWFTWVLLHMFIIYYLVDILCVKFRSNIPIFLLWIVCLFGYSTLYMPKEFGSWYKTDFMMYSSFYQTVKFMHFFVFGNLVHRYWKGTQSFMDSRWMFSLMIIIAFFSCADIFRWHFCKFEWTNFPKTIAMYSLLFIVVITFRYYCNSLSNNTFIGRSLQYIGVRTLDIYLLHFLLLPKMPEVGQWLDAHHPNFLLEIFASMSVALLVTAACLLISNILRVSPIFKEYLFGRR